MNSTGTVFLKKWQGFVDADPSRPAFADEKTAYTRGESWTASGKIYSYLKEAGLGRDSFVMVNMTRGAGVFVAVIGILRAGCAYVIVEAGYPEERTRRIKELSKAGVVIDDGLFRTIQSGSAPLTGYEDADEHDPACLVFTSGTTGSPKGVIHERGVIEVAMKSLIHTGGVMETEDVRFGVTVPLNFVAANLIIDVTLFCGASLYIPSYETIKNPVKFFSFLKDNRISETFLPPNMYCRYHRLLPNCVKLVYLGAAQSDNIPSSSRTVYNLYMASETGFVICKHRVAGGESPCPVGLPGQGVEVKLSPEGEVLCRVPFTRGYVDSDNSVFQDGWYHTGDLARINGDGLYVLTGRSSNIVKIDGNRVEPEEVEHVAARIAGIECVVRGFENSRESFLALYYVPKPGFDPDLLCRKMQETLPYYMIPSRFVKIARIPVSKNGKIDRMSLPSPERFEVPYSAPETDFEKSLCRNVARVLKLRKVGMNDDFFNLGGQSLDVIDVMGKMGDDKLQSTFFYKGRTLRGISELYYAAESTSKKTEQEKEMEGRRSLQPIGGLNAGAVSFMFDSAACRGVNLNIPQVIKLSPLVNCRRLAKCTNDYLASSSTFQTVICRDDGGNVCFKFAPERLRPVVVERMSESEALAAIDGFIRPFDLFDELPYRIRIVSTEKGGYFMFDIYHMMSDGFGVSQTIRDIFRKYFGLSPKYTNNFYAWIEDDRIATSPEIIDANTEVLKGVFDHVDWAVPYHDAPGSNIEYSSVVTDTGVSVKALEKAAGKNGLSRLAVIMSAFALAMAGVTGKKDIFSGYEYLRRGCRKNIAGYTASMVSVGFRLGNVRSLKDLYTLVSEELSRSAEILIPQYSVPATSEYGIWSVDDLGDFLNLNPLQRMFIRLVPTPRTTPTPPDYVNNIKFFNRGDRVMLDAMFNECHLHLSSYHALADSLSCALRRIVEGDESVIAEYLL